MNIEKLGSESLGNPHIVDTRVLIDDQVVSIPTLEGKVYRNGVIAQLGKRLICAQEIEATTTSEVTDPQTNKTTTVTSKAVRYLDGSVNNADGESVYLGCGTEILCLKPSPEKGITLCCDIPMSLKQPQILPSAD